ncbi:MAG: hypothetical protein JKY00_04325 [Roseicyclus sp.]|nr:hypothetical protein [Roseicyclus sp.]
MSVERSITTPAAINDKVLAYARTLGDGVAEFVDVSPGDDAIEDQCFFNVIMAGDGSPVFGWLIWELTGFWLEAVRHAVVERDGRLVDITPPIDGEATVVFVRDAGWAFDYLNPKPTRRAPRFLLTDDADVRKWAAIGDNVDTFKWRNTHFKGQKAELVLPPGKDMRRMERLQRDYNAAAKIALGKDIS